MIEVKQPKNKERFLKIYANLPLNIRREIICVVDDEPVTWNASYLEIRNNTKIGEKILTKLADFEII
ncbi:MAG: hypothetical protein HQ539_00550 [Parcubacteria group bacterium]|nr:hypothetical protein [Parcubacteria group bacterium]